MIPVELTTELGVIELAVHEEQAPASAGYFLADVRNGLYDGTSFFRIVTLANQRAIERAASDRGDPGRLAPSARGPGAGHSA